MRLHEKSPHELHSQAIVFANENSAETYHKEQLVDPVLMRDMGRLALHPQYSDYVDSLRSQRRLHGRNGEIESRTTLQGAYQEFEPIIGQLQAEISESTDAQSHTDFAGAGTRANTYGVSKDGNEYIVRIAKHDAEDSTLWSDKYVGGMLAAQGAAHMEQVAAVSYEDGVIVSERMPGRSLDKVAMNDMRQVTPKQMQEFVDTLTDAHNRAIRLDTHPSNFMYDTEQGFGLIDLESNAGRPGTTLGRTIELAAGALAGIGNDVWYDMSQDEATDEYYRVRADILNTRLGVLQRFGEAVERSAIDTTERERAIHKINTDIGWVEGTLQKETDPAYILQRQEFVRNQRQYASVAASSRERHDTDDWSVPTPPGMVF